MATKDWKKLGPNSWVNKKDDWGVISYTRLKNVSDIHYNSNKWVVYIYDHVENKEREVYFTNGKEALVFVKNYMKTHGNESSNSSSLGGVF